MHQRFGEPIPAPADQVHHHEREVVGDVELAQRGFELHAVDNLKRLAEEHVLGAQVAVPLSHQPPSCAGVQHLRVRRHERVREALQGQNSLDLGALLDDPNSSWKFSVIRRSTVNTGVPLAATRRARA